MNKNSAPNTYIIKDLDTLRAIAEPIRVQIMEVLQIQPGTVRDVAEKLGLAPSKLYYHFNALEKYGLIEVVETRQVANLLEKQFSTKVDRIDIAPELLTFSSEDENENLYAIYRSTMDTTREDLVRSLQARSYQLNQGAPSHPRRVVVYRQIARLTDEQADLFLEKLTDLCKEFEALDSGQPDAQVYAITSAFYPSFYYSEAETSQDLE